FCGRSGCSVDITKSNQTFQTTSSCIRQHPFAYGSAKKFTIITPSTNPWELCDVLPPRKIGPVYWKYSIYSHIQSAHPRYWDDVEGAPINLSEDFSTKIAISWEELNAMGITIGISTAPSANSLLPKTRGTKHSLAVTDENPAKRRRF
ncbi:hypothetical protein C8J57DRAFT_1075392, partial [Mycena rebaudengoi]